MHKHICNIVKQYHDSIHGYIPLSYFATRIIDTKYFQRLSKLNQVGTCNYVYRNAIHTRFEHSVGTYFNANELLNTIVSTIDNDLINIYLNSIPELKNYFDNKYDGKIHILDEYICELIKIAALCHDIGHGPFSHVFDDCFISETSLSDHPNATHESRSCIILEKIIKQDETLRCVGNDEIQFMQNLINPKSCHIGFLYQIVSNNLNGLDVDKFDYLPRDIHMTGFQAKVDAIRLMKHIKIIDNKIVYPEQSIDDIYNLFQTRHRLHRRVYCHKTVIAVQFMIVEIMKLLDDILQLSSSIEDMDKFSELTDDYIFESVKLLNKFKTTMNLSNTQIHNIEIAQNIVNKLDERKIYATVFSKVTQEKINISKIIDDLIDKENIIVFSHKIGFVSGNKPNPLNSIYVYKTKDSTKISRDIEAFKKDKNDTSTLISDSYQEYLLMIFYKDKTNTKRIEELKNYFITQFDK